MDRHDPTRRHETAPEEIGRTAISRAGAIATVVTLLALIVAPSATDLMRRQGVRDAFAALAGQARAATGGIGEGLLAANRSLLAAMGTFEDALEDDSLLRERLLPPVQLALARTLGLGNEQAYLGRDGWLFYRADMDHVTGPPFLSRSVQRRRILDETPAGGPTLRPDPLPALTALHEDLAARGVQLIVIPTPVKLTLAAERFSRRYGGQGPGTGGRSPGLDAAILEPGNTAGYGPRNPSEAVLFERLSRSGIKILDTTPLLEEARAASGESQYLATDTHWRPEAMDRVAAELARRIERDATFGEPGIAGYEERVATIEGVGDIAVMLRLPERQRWLARQQVTIRPVLTWEGRAWRPARDAEVLLLGDSFTNVFSDAGLGWGAGAGLAERLAFHLQRPVDRISRNAGGSHVTRRLLAEALREDPHRLDRVRVVVYQFAVRELSQGDWPVIPLAPK